MMDQIKNMEKLLYEQYYHNDQTPDNLVSSYWRESFKKMKAQESDGKVTSFQGYNFGDMQCTTLPSLVFRWITIISYIFKLKNRVEIMKMMKTAIPLAKKMGFPFTYDCFRQVCTLVLLGKNISRERQLNAIIIGDGYGFLAALIKEVFSAARIYLVDLGKTLLFQCHYCSTAHPDLRHHLITNENCTIGDVPEADFVYCPAEHLSRLDSIKFDWAVNVCSMQEMNESTIRDYFDFLRNHMTTDHLFYCCNREEKIMPGGEESRFSTYPWYNDDCHLVDEICPWQKHICLMRRAERGPKIFDWRIPFVSYFDGDVRHRLSKLQNTRNNNGIKKF